MFAEDAREQELTRLMRTYGDSVKRLCCVYLRDLGVAEDAAQETFIRAYEHADRLLSGEINNEKAWLMTIAVNACRSMLRSSWMRHVDRRQSIETLPLASPSGEDMSLALTQAIATLPVKLRELVLLHYYQDLNLRICAKILGISPATATRRLQQAQKKLRDELERG